MAILHHTRRRGFNHTRRSGRMSIDDMMRSTDVTLHVVIIVLLIAFAFGTWYFYGTIGSAIDNTITGSSTVTEPVTSTSSPNASPTQPAPSPNPGP
jgi:hypothetical protein